MERIVLPELLDTLPPRDQSALRSRRDLRRINAWMRHPRVMAQLAAKYSVKPDAPQIVEFGAGDGHFLLSVARRLKGQWPGAEVTLVDRLDALDPQTRDQFQRLGWHIHAEIAEASEWLRKSPPNPAGRHCQQFISPPISNRAARRNVSAGGEIREPGHRD